MPGALLLSVVYHTHIPIFTVDKQAILQRESGSPGLFTWREGSQASQLTDAMGKGSFHIILRVFKAQRVFMLDKCILKN